LSQSFFDQVERPLLSAWKEHQAAVQHDIDLRHRATKKAWRAWIHRRRLERRLRTPLQVLGTLLLLILACGVLIWSLTVHR
jgi:hypothetical protein